MLFRVISKTTGSLQHTSTYWQKEVLYCGYDIEEARRIYHESEPQDFGGSYGNRCRRTIFESLGTEDLDDDEVGSDAEWETGDADY